MIIFNSFYHFSNNIFYNLMKNTYTWYVFQDFPPCTYCIRNRTQYQWHYQELRCGDEVGPESRLSDLCRPPAVYWNSLMSITPNDPWWPRCSLLHTCQSSEMQFPQAGAIWTARGNLQAIQLKPTCHVSKERKNGKAWKKKIYSL